MGFRQLGCFVPIVEPGRPTQAVASPGLVTPALSLQITRTHSELAGASDLRSAQGGVAFERQPPSPSKVAQLSVGGSIPKGTGVLLVPVPQLQTLKDIGRGGSPGATVTGQPSSDGTVTARDDLP